MSWTPQPKRNGNDELPTDRVAVKIIRSSQTIDSPRSQRGNSPTKQPVTKVSKLVYETKRQPTTAVVKSIHSYSGAVGTSNSPDQKHQKRINDSTVTKEPKNSNFKSEFKSGTYPRSDKSLHLPVSQSETQNKLIQKRLDIQKDVNEINQMLQGLTDNNPQCMESENADPQPSDAPNIPISNMQHVENIPQVNVHKSSESSTRRSKTDPNISGRGRSRSISNAGDSNRRSVRSKSSAGRSQPAESVAASNITQKQRSYDPDKARQYMQEQKERRKVQAATEKSISARIERDEIKKRLENLRKNTLSILQKNVKRAQNKSKNGKSALNDMGDAAPANLNNRIHSRKQDHPSPRQYFIPDPPSPNKEEEINADTHKGRIPQKKLTNQVKPLQTLERNKSVNPPQKPKKVGLLRRTETDVNAQFESVDTLEVAIGKENVFRVPFTKPQETKASSPVVSTNSQLEIKPVTVVLEKSLPELELNVPDVKLKPKSRPSVAEKSTQAEPQHAEKTALPYWLQPTPVQLYPYNFIKAVRKKLEAITNPVLSTKDQQTETIPTTLADIPKQSLPTATLPLSVAARRRLLSRPNLNEVSSINIEPGQGHKISSASSVFTPFLNSPAVSPKQSTTRNNATHPPQTSPPAVQDYTKSLSEITSSVTVNIPRSNTVSDVSSINSDMARKPRLSSTQISKRIQKTSRKHDDDTTASSSVFSSPEKRLPLIRKQSDMTKISDSSKNSFVGIAQSKEEEHLVSPLSIDKINNLTLKSKSSITSLGEVKSREDFELMLQDFNKSLSHVIEVNQQLQTTLSQSPRSNSKSTAESVKTDISDKENKSQSRSGSRKSEKYSSDFEKSASETATNNGEVSDAAKIESQIEQKASNKSSSTSIRTIASNSSGYLVQETQRAAVSSPKSQRSLDESSVAKPTTEETMKNCSNQTENFPDSIEEVSYMKIIMSPNRQQPLQDSNNFSRDSLEITKNDVMEDTQNHKSRQLKEDIFRNQINVIRGDGMESTRGQVDILVSHTLQSNASPIRMSDDSVSHRPILNSSLGSDIFAIFNQSEMELSIISQSSRVSEAPLNYSTLGLYEQLIKTEATKTEHLTALLKIREKSILDRTRGQIALLEIQKEKCKAKGLTMQISIIKRKQRAILMKMEKEREEIRRVLKLSERDSNQKRNSESLHVPKIPELPASMDLSLRRNSHFRNDVATSRRVVRGYELDTSQNLETLLLSRERELQKRRDHVERLLKWHQRLDKEEEEVLKIEEMLYKYNQEKQSQHDVSLKSEVERKKDKKLLEINKSLRELQSISTNSGNETVTSKGSNAEYVRTSGRKLNKLWCRLTGRKEVRFEQAKRYKLTKIDLEKIYEDAKVAVITDFNENDRMAILSDQSKCHQSSENIPMHQSVENSSKTKVPRLNLNFSSGASEIDQPETEESVENTSFTRVNNNTEKESASDDFVQNFTDDNIKANERIITSCESSTVSKSSSEGEDTTAKSPIINSSDKEITSVRNSEGDAEKMRDCTDPTISTNDIEAGIVEEKVSCENGETGAISEQPNSDISIMSLTYVTECRHSESPLLDSLNSVGLLKDEIYENGYSVEKSEANAAIAKTSCHDEIVEKINESLSMIEDISAPKFESTGEDTIADEQISEIVDIESQSNSSDSANMQIETPKSLSTSAENQDERPPSVLEKRLTDLENSLIELNNSFERVLSPDANKKAAISFERVLSPDDTYKAPQMISESDSNSTETTEEKITQAQDLSITKVTVKDFLLNPEITSSLMPDIINEVELRRRQQVLVESDIIHLENAVPHALLREIPNKPPPPYVPPAHGSPMTTIFPSEARIKDIAFRRTNELYEEVNGNDISSDQKTSILDENITNIYERIILDICKECVNDYQPTFTENLVVVGSYKMPLALYNPPNRLKCVQEFVYKRVRKLLSMDKRPKRTNSIFSLGRRKRDHVDEILIQELFEEEHKWTNFDLEEEEVRDSVVDEVFEEVVKELIENFEESYVGLQRAVKGNSNKELSHNGNSSDLCKD